MTITVYTQPACGPCTATKRALDSQGTAFAEEPAADHLEILRNLGHQRAPVVVVRADDGEVLDHWSQFQLDKIQALKAA